MAKTGLWLNGAKGKMAGTTIYQSNGETVMRVINRSIKNPRSKAQLIQRIITKTVMKQYSAMKAICDHSFEGVSAGANSMARFATINNTLLRERIAKAQQEGDAFSEIYNFIPLKTSKFIPAAVQLSEGSLPRVNAGGAGVVGINYESGNITYADVINSLELERGDQLTFIGVYKDANGNYNFKFARVILDPRETDGTAAPLSTAFIDNNKVNKPSFRNEGSFYTIATAAVGLEYQLSADTPVAAAVIASRKVNDTWLRSTETLAMVDDALATSDNISLQKALDLAIQGNEIYTDSERFLNNAGEGGPQAGGAPVEVMSVSVDGVNFSDVVDGVAHMRAEQAIIALIKGIAPDALVDFGGHVMTYVPELELFSSGSMSPEVLPVTVNINGAAAFVVQYH